MLVDEGQDLSALHWQLVRCARAQASNDIFIAEDVHQRIYGHRIVLARYGIKWWGRVAPTHAELPNHPGEPASTHWGCSETLSTSTAPRRRRLATAIVPRVGARFHASYRASRLGADGCRCSTITEWKSAGVGDSIAVLGRTTLSLKRLQRQLEIAEMATVLYGSRCEAGHSAAADDAQPKGLEFSRVILFDVSDGSIPLARATARSPGATSRMPCCVNAHFCTWRHLARGMSWLSPGREPPLAVRGVIVPSSRARTAPDRVGLCPLARGITPMRDSRVGY